MSNKFYRSERLKSRREIQRLFERGTASVKSYPLRLVFGPTEEQRGNYPLQIGFSVPKRNFKHAVDRNRIKRLLREAYRLNKAALLEGLPDNLSQYAVMVIYTGREEMTFRQIERKLKKAFTLLVAKVAVVE